MYSRTRAWPLCLFLTLSAIAIVSMPAGAQVLYGSIVGIVQDPSGGAIPNAAVSVTNTETGLTVTDKTDEAGRFNLQNLAPGRYDLKVTSTGFRTFARTGIVVSANTIARADTQLEVGSQSEQVSVQAEAVELQTDKSDTHTTITTQAITQMPLPGYRNYQSLMNLVPGATPTRFQNSMTDTPGRALATNVNGTNANNNVTRIDGAASINVWLPHHAGYVMPEEMVQEVNITTTAADAEQGMAGGSSVTLVTKSGTNDFHGSAFEFHDDQHLKARNFFQAPGVDKPLGIYNNYGGTLGGPIIKNKLFWFFSYDATRQKIGANGTYSVPTSDIRSGNFSAYLPTSAGGTCTANCAIIYDPRTGDANGNGRTPFAGNIVPAGLISTQAQKILSYLPLPNQSGPQNNYFAVAGPILDRDYTDGKVDFNMSERERIWGRYGRMWATSGGVGIFGQAVGPSPGADPGLGDTVVQNMSVGHTHTFSPTVLLDGVFGYQRQHQTVTGSDYGQNFGQILGIPGMNGSSIEYSGFPTIDVGGAYSATGVPNWMPLFRVEENFTTSQNLTWTKGAHELRFGFDGLLLRLNHWQPELSAGGPRGYFYFDPAQTGLSGSSLAPNYLNAFAAFLLGNVSNIQKGQQYILMTGREWQFGWYVRDRWQVTRKLTVNLGLRYELYPLMTRAAGKGIERYDPAANVVYMGGRGNVPMDAGISTNKKLFAPRIGIAYRVTDNTVIRTGYGINYDPLPFSRPLRGFYPLTINASFNAANSYSTVGTLASGIPAFSGPDLSSGVVPLPLNADERSPGTTLTRGYIQSWNFTVERKLPADFVTSVGYVGTETTHQMAYLNTNSAPPGTGTAGRPYYKLYGRSVDTYLFDGFLSSNYHSLQVAINKQFSKGLLIKGAYTWSKAINMTDDDGWTTLNWNWGPVFNRNRATAGYDRTHIFQLGWVYELPAGPGKKVLNSGVASRILGGWQINGIMAAYTGTPFTIGGGSALNAPGNSQTADQVGPLVYTNGVGSTGFWFDPSAFKPVTDPGRFGTTGRNIVRGPGLWNTDLSLFKNIRITERVNMQFRTEAFNVTNSSHFNNPSSSSTSSTFGRITSSYGERQFRFGLRLAF